MYVTHELSGQYWQMNVNKPACRLTASAIMTLFGLNESERVLEHFSPRHALGKFLYFLLQPTDPADGLWRPILQGHLGGWAMPWSAEEVLDGQRQRMVIPTLAGSANNSRPQKRLGEDLCWIVRRVPPTNHSVKGLNWTEPAAYVSLWPDYSKKKKKRRFTI